MSTYFISMSDTSYNTEEFNMLFARLYMRVGILLTCGN